MHTVRRQSGSYSLNRSPDLVRRFEEDVCRSGRQGPQPLFLSLDLLAEIQEDERLRRRTRGSQGGDDGSRSWIGSTRSLVVASLMSAVRGRKSGGVPASETRPRFSPALRLAMRRRRLAGFVMFVAGSSSAVGDGVARGKLAVRARVSVGGARYQTVTQHPESPCRDVLRVCRFGVPPDYEQRAGHS